MKVFIEAETIQMYIFLNNASRVEWTLDIYE